MMGIANSRPYRQIAQEVTVTRNDKEERYAIGRHQSRCYQKRCRGEKTWTKNENALQKTDFHWVLSFSGGPQIVHSIETETTVSKAKPGGKSPPANCRSSENPKNKNIFNRIKLRNDRLSSECENQSIDHEWMIVESALVHNCGPICDYYL